ncbi:hypothetical protein IC607_08560 [Cellulomonas sp. JH27-2]|uniref:hypothetical protein n=1 Tax=Cellulomonas sp. JH27-2 TaxID=2774139 RepID=UPI0017807AA9|nr:hypothetical protein [Cellulomonas sp. JH27-2]MBD8059018.1 hypothetical protein [Cellulomonas sp. JH27-2]
MGHARWQAARQDARQLDALVRDAETAGESAEYVAALIRARDGALSRALSAQEELSGTWQQRERTRSAHLALHGPGVLADLPADEPVQPARTDAWGADGRHSVTGSRFDEAGYSQSGFHRTTRRDALGYHELTGTLLSPSGHLPDGRHHTEAGLTRDDAHLTTADDVVAGNVELPPVPKTVSAAKAIEDARRSEKADQTPAKVAESKPGAADVAPFRSKKAVAAALRTPGSRWAVERDGTTTPVTVVRSSTTSIWVRPDDAPADAKPAWLPIGNQSAWNVHDDGFDEDGATRIRRLAA